MKPAAKKTSTDRRKEVIEPELIAKSSSPQYFVERRIAAVLSAL
jgi:hypothetical protein